MDKVYNSTIHLFENHLNTLVSKLDRYRLEKEQHFIKF